MSERIAFSKPWVSELYIMFFKPWVSEPIYVPNNEWVSLYVPNHERVSLYMFQTMSEWAYISPSKEVEASMGQNIICWNVGTSNEENSKNQNTGTKRNGVFSTDQGSWSFDGSEHYFAKCWHQQWGKFKKKSKYGHEANWRIFPPIKEVEASTCQNIILWNVGTSNGGNSKNQNTGT